MVDREDEIGGVAGGAARIRQRPLVDLDDVSPPSLGQVPDDGVADDPGPDHYHPGGGGQLGHCCSLRTTIRNNATKRHGDYSGGRNVSIPAPRGRGGWTSASEGNIVPSSGFVPYRGTRGTLWEYCNE